MRVETKSPAGCGWNDDKTVFHSSTFTSHRREANHDEIVAKVVTILKRIARPGKLLKNGDTSETSWASNSNILNRVNDLIGMSRLPETCWEDYEIPENNVHCGHLNDACEQLGIPVVWLNDGKHKVFHVVLHTKSKI